jgi:hypothetical protein
MERQQRQEGAADKTPDAATADSPLADSLLEEALEGMLDLSDDEGELDVEKYLDENEHLEGYDSDEENEQGQAPHQVILATITAPELPLTCNCHTPATPSGARRRGEDAAVRTREEPEEQGAPCSCALNHSASRVGINVANHG